MEAFKLTGHRAVSISGCEDDQTFADTGKKGRQCSTSHTAATDSAQQNSEWTSLDCKITAFGLADLVAEQVSAAMKVLIEDALSDTSERLLAAIRNESLGGGKERRSRSRSESSEGSAGSPSDIQPPTTSKSTVSRISHKSIHTTAEVLRCGAEKKTTGLKKIGTTASIDTTSAGEALKTALQPNPHAVDSLSDALSSQLLGALLPDSSTKAEKQGTQSSKASRLFDKARSSVNFDAVSQLREQNTNNIIRKSRSTECTTLTEPLSRISMGLLKCCGVVPATSIWREVNWRRAPFWYQCSIMIFVAASAVFSLHPWMNMCMDTSVDCVCHHVLLSDVPLSLGSFFGLAALIKNTQDVVACFQLFHSYACLKGFDVQWLYLAQWDAAMTLFLWLGTVVERARAIIRFSDGVDALLSLRIIAFALSSLVMFGLGACALFFCRAMSCAVDSFCYAIVEEQVQLDTAVPRWNVVQALLRKGSAALQLCLLVLQTTVLCLLLVAGADAYRIRNQEQCTNTSASRIVLLVPGTLVVVGMFNVLFKASEVTNKCARVPSLMNACNFGDEVMDSKRQYAVEYVLYSAAGFYIFDVRITSGLALRLTYVTLVAIFGFFTHIFSS